jgi:hypothetical protein
MKEVFKGKTVAFVGLAPNIEGKGLGHEIDAHDIVYRTNTIPSNYIDYGSKCDVISVLKMLFDLIPENVPNIITFETHEKSTYIVTDVERLNIRGWCMLKFGIDIFDGTGGMVAYWLAKKYGAKSIKFYGITGYQDLSGNVVNHSDGWRHYIDEAYLSDEGFEKAKLVDMPNYDCHNFWNQNTIFRELLKKGKIDMDEFSKEYFKHGRKID